MKLTVFAKGLPICRKYEISGEFNLDKNDYCPIILSLNTEKEDEAILKASKRIAKFIKQSLR
ncbi:MAG: putative adenine nucleotide alpha hydrolase (AANH) superfamily ATPase [Vicingaceae bacterium]